MARFHLIRVGVMGNVGRFYAPDAVAYPRGVRVIVRTERGLETGDVLGPADEIPRELADGTLLRGMTVQDDLLDARLAQNREAAYDACAKRLEELAVSAVLMDVEHLFDGRSLIFYFLGEVTPALESITAELADLYDANVKFRQFTESVLNGCGPDCGTEDAAGCGSCAAGCALASGCSTNHPGNGRAS